MTYKGRISTETLKQCLSNFLFLKKKSEFQGRLKMQLNQDLGLGSRGDA